MRTKKSLRGKLLWAFNPFQDRSVVLRNAHSALLRISKHGRLDREAVYVVSPAEVNVVLEFSVPARDRYRTVALARARKVLRELKDNDLEPKILVEKSLSLSASSKALADYAETEGAEAILASVRAKKSLGQVLMGSFAESLLYQARCPVILLNPGQRMTVAPRRLLFASDLSPVSLNAFTQFCRFARVLGAEIFLFHSIPRPFSWASFAVDSLLGPDRPSERQYLIHTRKLREGDLKPFAEMAKSHGLKFSSSIAIGGEDVAMDILKEARRMKIDMLGMAGKSGRLKTQLLGSVSKSLIGRTRLPVWIRHSR